ncbi:MAG: hypothetical protein WBB25_16000, partial [Sulfitobacter sp.]
MPRNKPAQNFNDVFDQGESDSALLDAKVTLACEAKPDSDPVSSSKPDEEAPVTNTSPEVTAMPSHPVPSNDPVASNRAVPIRGSDVTTRSSALSSQGPPQLNSPITRAEKFPHEKGLTSIESGPAKGPSAPISAQQQPDHAVQIQTTPSHSVTGDASVTVAILSKTSGTSGEHNRKDDPANSGISLRAAVLSGGR